MQEAPRALCGLEQELDLDRLVREDDAPAVRPIEDARTQQGGNVGMNRLDVSIDSARRLADRYGLGVAERF